MAPIQTKRKFKEAIGAAETFDFTFYFDKLIKQIKI